MRSSLLTFPFEAQSDLEAVTIATLTLQDAKQKGWERATLRGSGGILLDLAYNPGHQMPFRAVP